MTIESINGAKKYRQSPANVCMVQVRYGERWVDYAPRDTPKEAKDLVLALMQVKQAEFAL